MVSGPIVDALETAVQPKRKVAKGSFTDYPERMRLGGSESDGMPGIPEKPLAEIMDRAMKQADQSSVFRIHLPTADMMSGQSKAAYDKVKNQIDSYNAWSTSVCERQVQRKIDMKELPSDDQGAIARSSYRATVFDWLFRQSTWFGKTLDQNMSRHIECKKAEFHTEILKVVLEGFIVPTSVLTQLDAVLNTISDGVLQAKRNNDTPKQQIMVMFFKYTYDEYSDTVDVVVRTIEFSTSQALSDYTVNKASYDGVKTDLLFSQFEAIFNSDIYAKLQDQIDPQQIELGKKLLDMTKNANLELPIPV